MAVAGAHAKQKFLEYSDKEWYHGELSRAEAEQVLTASGCDCFLVRVSEGALILSLIHHGQLHHINIKYIPGWYELEIGESQYTLGKLEELGSSTKQRELQKKLGVACKRTSTKDRSLQSHSVQKSSTVPIYDKAEPEDLKQHSWYHGNITKIQAEAALQASNDNGFLVRVSSGGGLVLSMRISGWLSHDVIHYSPKGYHLDGKNEQFQSVPEMIEHYQHHSIQAPQVLGTAISTIPSVQELQEVQAYDTIKFRKNYTNLKMQWQKSGNLPDAISAPQVVKIGDSVYVGGGMRRSNENLVYKFDIQQKIWTILPSCPTQNHALVTFSNELTAIGGLRGTETVNAVYTFRSGEWIEVLPPMPTPRYLLAAVSYGNRFVLAAGGETMHKSSGEAEVTTAVEVYFKEQNIWQSINPLPFPIRASSVCIIEDTCFLLGGTGHSEHAHIVLHFDISSLMKDTRPAQHIAFTWKQFSDKHPLCFSTGAELDKRMVTFGGSSHAKHRSGTKFVGVYDFSSDMWMECKGAKLPVPLYRAGVVKLDNSRVMIVGGQTKMQQFSPTVLIGYMKQETQE